MLLYALAAFSFAVGLASFRKADTEFRYGSKRFASVVLYIGACGFMVSGGVLVFKCLVWFLHS